MTDITITNVMAVSLDGMIASAPGESDATRRDLGFTNEADRQHLRAMVAACDAVIAGAETVRASRRLFAERNDRGVVPTWYIPTTRGLDEQLPLWLQTEVPKILVTESSSLKAPHATDILRTRQGGTVEAIMTSLREQKLQRVLLLGGASINKLFYEQRLVNRLVVTVCPIILAAKGGIPLVSRGLPEPTHLKLITSHSIGNLVFLSYSVI